MKRTPLRRRTPLDRSGRLRQRRDTPRRGTWRSRALLEATRLMACAFCDKRPPNSAHHFPGKGHLAGVDDRLACPACGDGTRGCHGRAQRYEITAEAQLAAVGRTLHTHLLAGRVTLADIDEALQRVPRHDWREIIRRAATGA